MARRAWVTSALNIIPFYALADVLFIFRSDRRCIRDRISGTQVVQSVGQMGRFLTRKRALWFVGFLLADALAVLLLWSAISGPDVVYYLVRYGDTEIDDFKHWPGRSLQASASPYHFTETANESGMPTEVTVEGVGTAKLDDLLPSNDTIAFLVIKNDTLLFERYFQGHTQSSLSQAFSTSKSILSILIGVAVHEGLIKSVDQTVTEFVPELADNGFGNVTIESLLQMRSGMDYVEDDSPFSMHARFNLTTSLEDQIFKLQMKEESTETFIYKSGDNALLAVILDRAIGARTITEYAQEKLWGPLGMEYDGVWSTDHEGGLEKTWCCLAAAARDFAKFGRLYLNDGKWNGDQVVSQSWVERSTTGAFDASNWPSGQAYKGFENYGYQWWLASEEKGDYVTRGKNGQFIYVNPNYPYPG